MIVYGVKENGSYAGFSLTDDLERDRLDYVGTPLELVELGSSEEQTARNLVDYLTYVKDNNGPYDMPQKYGIEEGSYILTAEGNALMPTIFKGE